MFKKFRTQIIIIVGILIFFAICLYIGSYVQKPFQAEVMSAKVNDATISYYTRGNGDPIVLLPGFGMTMQHWDPLLLEQLSKNHTLVMLDYRGVGKSSGSVANLSQAEMANDVVGLMDHLHLKKTTILGWSLGSFVAQVVAEQHPDRVEKLILIGTGPGGDKQVESSEEISNAIQNNLAGTWADVYTRLMFSTDDARQAYLDRLYLAQARKEVPTGSEESLEMKSLQEKLFGDPDQEEARFAGLAKITAPTFIIVGDQDKLLVPENAKITAKTIPHAQLHITAKAGHAVLFEKAVDTATLIESFVDQK
jgi:pimeloyl-ACP methyl ester carboxylesterase